MQEETAVPSWPDDARLGECETRIGYRFAQRRFLREALTHASGAEHRVTSNERLEFLGDAILGAVVCEALFLRFPEYLEGDLTRIKSMVVSRQTCTKISHQLALQEFLYLGKGMITHPSLPDSVMADVFEALVAAIYLDGGHAAAQEFVQRYVLSEIEEAAGSGHGGNYKSILQQMAQRDFGATPAYCLLDEKGPDHNKCFKISAQIGGQRYQAAWGRNKKEAEQRAALNALSEIGGREAPFSGD